MIKTILKFYLHADSEDILDKYIAEEELMFKHTNPKFISHKIICPICGKHTIDNYYICNECGWEQDDTLNLFTKSSCNGMSILGYRICYTIAKMISKVKNF